MLTVCKGSEVMYFDNENNEHEAFNTAIMALDKFQDGEIVEANTQSSSQQYDNVGLRKSQDEATPVTRDLLKKYGFNLD